MVLSSFSAIFNNHFAQLSPQVDALKILSFSNATRISVLHRRISLVAVFFPKPDYQSPHFQNNGWSTSFLHFLHKRLCNPLVLIIIFEVCCSIIDCFLHVSIKYLQHTISFLSVKLKLPFRILSDSPKTSMHLLYRFARIFSSCKRNRFPNSFDRKSCFLNSRFILFLLFGFLKHCHPDDRYPALFCEHMRKRGQVAARLTVEAILVQLLPHLRQKLLMGLCHCT